LSNPGLLNVDEPDVVAGLVQRISAEFSACLQPAGDFRRARLLLRFAAALVPTNVVHAASMLAVLQSLVDTAVSIAEASEWAALSLPE
jgi:pyrroloquinoline quinone (PQQ) biosynthesis protein C